MFHLISFQDQRTPAEVAMSRTPLMLSPCLPPDLQLECYSLLIASPLLHHVTHCRITSSISDTSCAYVPHCCQHYFSYSILQYSVSYRHCFRHFSPYSSYPAVNNIQSSSSVCAARHLNVWVLSLRSMGVVIHLWWE